MQKLIDLLTAKTQDLKAEYILRVENYVTEYWYLILEKAAWKTVDWYAAFKIKTVTTKDYLGKPLVTTAPGECNTNRYAKMRNAQDTVRKLVKKGFEDLKARELKHAEAHYNDSVLKLAYRITEKGLTFNNITVASGRVGVNFEVVISDGNLTVKAWTIIAQGPVQRPHYRYLVK